MGWLEAIKSFLIALPKLLDEFRALRETIAQAAKDAENRKIQEVRDEQREIKQAIERLQNDQDRMALARRIADLERRL